MAGSKSNWLSKALLDHTLGKSQGGNPFTFTPASTVYVGLWTSGLSDAADGTTSGEPSGAASYARVAVTNDSSNWPDAAGSTTAEKHNGAAVNFPTATGSWGTVTQFALLSAASSGNIYYWSDLTTPKTISTGDTASFGVGAISITEN